MSETPNPDDWLCSGCKSAEGVLIKRDALLKERDELRAVLRDLLEERGVDKYRKRLVDAYAMAEMLRPKHTSTDGDRRTQALQSGAVQAFGHAIDWLDEATAGALR